MDYSTLTATCLIVVATCALCACDKQSSTREATNKERGIEPLRSGEHKAGEGSGDPSVGRAEKSGLVEPETASTMKLSFPLERSANKP